MTEITNIHAREILDARGNPTIEGGGRRHVRYDRSNMQNPIWPPLTTPKLLAVEVRLWL